MQATSFRIVSAIVILLLLAALVVLAIWTVGNEPSTIVLPTPIPSATSTATATPLATHTPPVTPLPSPTHTAIAPAETVTETAPAVSAGGILGRETPTISATMVVSTPIGKTPAESALPAPTATPVPSGPQGAWRTFSDANVMNGLAIISNTVWIATGGGAVAWNQGSSTPVKFTTADGLLRNQLSAVVACPLPEFGVVFGSAGGLQIADPNTGTWRSLGRADGGMRYDDVSALACDPLREILVIGYAAHGIDIYDVTRDSWRHLDRSSGLAANDVHHVALASDRNDVWVASEDGVTVAAGPASVFYNTANSPLTNNRIGAMAAGSDGAMWLGGDGALYQVDGETWTRYDQAGVNGQFPTKPITGLVVAADGTLWLGSADAEICHFDPVERRCLDFYVGAPGMAAGPLTQLSVDDDGQIFYTTAGNGYSTFDGERWSTFTKSDDLLRGNRVKALATDATGNVWVATEAGVQRFSGESSPPVLFDTANSGISPLGVRTLAPGARGGLWVGGQQGASFYDGKTWKTFTAADGLASEIVQAITADSQGRMWFGTDRGLSVWDGTTFFNIAKDLGLPSDDIRALASDGSGVWIGTAGGGLYRFENSQLQVFNNENVGLPGDTVTALALAPNGVLFIGTDRGLAQIADGELTVIPDAGSAAISSIAVTDDALWVGTADSGLFHFDGAVWTPLAPADGLPSPRISALLADGNDVWIGGQDGGLVRFLP